MPTCPAHYPVLLDGLAVQCDLPAGHEGQHEDHSQEDLGCITSFEDQPECYR